MPLTESQKRQVAQQNEARRHLPRIPTLIITEEDQALLTKMAKIYGSKTAALTAGLRALAEKDPVAPRAQIPAPKKVKLTLIDEKGPAVTGTVTHETAAYYTVVLDSTGETQKYSKKNGLRVGKEKHFAPLYKLTLVK